MNRFPPRVPAQAFQTYAADQARVPATCAEVRCEGHVKGWVTRVPAGSDLEDFVRHGNHGRRFQETTRLDSVEREFMFPPGQSCFRESQHRKGAGQQSFLVRAGDHRGGGLIRQHVSALDWREDMGEHLIKIKEDRERG